MFPTTDPDREPAHAELQKDTDAFGGMCWHLYCPARASLVSGGGMIHLHGSLDGRLTARITWDLQKSYKGT